MSFTDPLFLWLTLPVIALFALFAITERRPRPAWCRWWSLAVRSAVAVAVLVALAGPVSLQSPPAPPPGPEPANGALTEVVYIDGREWHDPAALRELLDGLPPQARLTRAPDGRLAEAVGTDALATWPAADSVEGSPVAAAPLHWLGADLHRLAGWLAPGGPRRLHIIGDAPPNDRQLDMLARAGIGFEFHPAPLVDRLPQPVLSAIEADSDEPEQDFPVHLHCRAFGPLAGAQWRLEVNGTAGEWQPVTPDEGTGGNAARLVADPLSLPAGAHGVTFELRTADGDTVAAHRGLIVRPPPRWVILADRGAAGAAGTAWIEALGGEAGLRMETVRQLPDDLFDCSGVIVPLVRLIRMRPTDIAVLRRYVREGGGLIVPCLTPTAIPADAHERLKGLLPVEVGPLADDPGGMAGVDPRDLPEDLARMAIVFLVDNSASMLASVGRGTRSQYVRAAVKAAIDRVQETDKVTVVFFDEAVRGSLGPYLATEANRKLLKQEVDDYPQPDHRTSIVAACNEAHRVLAREHAAIRHVVLLSDGEDTVSEMFEFHKLRDRFRDAGISCSAIGIGEFSPETLREIYTPGSGELHFADPRADAEYYRDKMPQLFFREVQKAQMRGDELMPPPGTEDPQSRRTGRFLVGKQVPGVTYARIVDEFPPVRRHMQLQARPGSLTVLEVQLDPRVAAAERRPNPWSPLLVTWRVGLGEVAAFGSALDPESMPDWVDDAATSRFVGAWLRALAHPRPGDYAAREITWTHGTDGGVAVSGRVAATSTDATRLPTGTRLEAELVGRLTDGVSDTRALGANDLQIDRRDGRFRLSLPGGATENYTAVRLRLLGLPGRAEPAVIGLEPIPPGPSTGTGGLAWWQRDSAESQTVAAPQPAAVADDPDEAADSLPPVETPLTGLTTILLLLAAVLIPVDVFLRR